MPIQPKFSSWPESAVDLDAQTMVRLYESGFAGAFSDPKAREELDGWMQVNGFGASGEDVAQQYGFADSSVGNLCVLFPSVVKHYGYESLTRPAQKTGDCVSKAGRDVSLYLICLDADSGTPDAVTGKVEAPPEVSDTARRNGVFANEGIYKDRGHNGQGMSCDVGLTYVMKKSGLILRKKYEQVDLESYNVGFEVSGSRGSPEWLNAIGRPFPIRAAARPRTWEAACDLIHQKCPIWVCSGLGFSSQRDQYGYSPRRGSWAHSWHVIGYDRRPWVQQHYGFPALALVGHRWGPWNSGPRRIKDTNLDIPEGYWWIDARLLNNCWMAAVNSVTGWPAKKLPDNIFSVYG